MKKNIAYIIIIFLLISSVFFAVKYFNLQKGIYQVKAVSESPKIQINEKVLEFTDFFVEKVIKAETKIDLETRLKLENMAKDIGDEEILVQWQAFVGSKTEIEAQNNVKNLLLLLVNKIRNPIL